MDEQPIKKPARRLTPWLWVPVGMLLGFGLAIGTDIKVLHRVNSGESFIRTQVYGVTVHERDAGSGAEDREKAMTKEIQTWGYGLPVGLTIAGGAIGYGFMALANSYHKSGAPS